MPPERKNLRLYLRPGMELLMNRFQAAHVNVGVDLRGGDRGVAEHLLHLRKSAPPASRWVAKLWRRVWGLISGGAPTRTA